MNKKVKIWYNFDMDGVLAKWDKAKSVYDTFKQNYFLSREPDMKMIMLMLMFLNRGLNARVASSVYTNEFAGPEKTIWLGNYGLGDAQRIFIPYGKNKADYVAAKDQEPEVKEYNILIDDFTKNLNEWEEAGNLGFKYYNGINGTNGTWTGNCIHHRMSPETMFRVITSVAAQWVTEQEEKEVR